MDMPGFTITLASVFLMILISITIGFYLYCDLKLNQLKRA